MQPRLLRDTLKADLRAVSKARVYFGHQSVGRNILDGLEDLQRGLGESAVRVVELGSASVADDRGILLHGNVGQNERPATKCEDFQRILDQELKGRVDVALFKFCYVDFNDTSDVAAIFDVYSRTLDDLKRRHPEVVFVHVTAPLRTIDRGPGVWMRELLGRRNRSKHANARRGEFNRLLKERYAGEPVFDLAATISTDPDGRRESFRLEGAEHHALVPAYTDDGGHLNAVGRTYAAAAFVHAIAEALARRAERAGPSERGRAKAAGHSPSEGCLGTIQVPGSAAGSTQGPRGFEVCHNVTGRLKFLQALGIYFVPVAGIRS